MTHVTVSESMRAQLGDMSEPLVLCDEVGKLIGTFTPVTKLTEHQRIALTLPDHLLNSPVPTEELLRRLREDPRIPHEEVVRKARQFL